MRKTSRLSGLKRKMAIYTTLQKILGRILPLKRNRIMFHARQNQESACDLKYIMEYFIKTYPGRYELIWVGENPEPAEKTPDFRTVAYRTGRYFLAFVQTKLYITDDTPDEYLYKREGQTVMMARHGEGAYGTAESDMRFLLPGGEKRTEKRYGGADYFLSGCRRCTEYYASAFHMAKERFLNFGLPGNDIFFRKEPAVAEKVRRHFGLAGHIKILLYAPSLRDGSDAAPLTRAELEELVRHLEKITGEPWSCVCRRRCLAAHADRKGSGARDKAEEKLLEGTRDKADGRLLEGARYPDMQELLYAADILLTDFFSYAWDFSFTGRPVFLYRADTGKEKRNDGGFLAPPEECPYPAADNPEELMKLAAAFRQADVRAEYRKKVIEHHHKLGAFDDGKATERTVRFLVDDIL